MTQAKGHFIVLEGMEGAGKSTLLQLIKQHLVSLGLEVVCTREPGGTRVGEAARQLIKEPCVDEALDSRAELLLLYASRVQLIEHVIRPALARGAWVLADRFELSTWAYQGGGRKLDPDFMQQLSRFCLQGFAPDVTFFLDLPPELGLQRVLQGRGVFDRIEQESLPFFHAVYDAYHEALKKLSNVIMIDARQALPEVQQAVLAQLERYLISSAQ